MGRLTAERLREVLDYDPKTGIFRWKIRTSNRIKVGNIAGGLCRTEWADRLYIRLFGKLYSLHRLAFLWMNGRWPINMVDHIDGDPLNNRWINLREATPQQNNANAKGRARTANRKLPKGVKKIRQKSGYRFRAEIGFNYCTTHLGVFDTPEQAHAAYMNAAERLFGAYARSA